MYYAVAEYPDVIVNKCIEVKVDGVGVKFDYKIKSGMAKNKNAVILMNQMGILNRTDELKVTKSL